MNYIDAFEEALKIVDVQVEFKMRHVSQILALKMAKYTKEEAKSIAVAGLVRNNATEQYPFVALLIDDVYKEEEPKKRFWRKKK